MNNHSTISPIYVRDYFCLLYTIFKKCTLKLISHWIKILSNSNTLNSRDEILDPESHFLCYLCSYPASLLVIRELTQREQYEFAVQKSVE